jgi:hypothetical protein
MLLSRHRNAGQNRVIKITTRAFENMSWFRYLGMTVTGQTLIQEKIKRRLDSGNACYHSPRTSCLLRCCKRKLKIKICNTLILPVVLYGCKTWSLTLGVEHRLRVFENIGGGIEMRRIPLPHH